MASAGVRAYMGFRGADDVFVYETLIFDASVIVLNKITILMTH